jgi:hypothetical protein
VKNDSKKMAKGSPKIQNIEAEHITSVINKKLWNNYYELSDYNGKNKNGGTIIKGLSLYGKSAGNKGAELFNKKYNSVYLD